MLNCNEQWLDLKIIKKTSKDYQLTLVDEDDMVIDITGWTVYFMVKENISDADINAKISKTIIIHTDPTNGITDIELTPTDTDFVGDYYYSIDVEDDEDNQTVLYRGRVTFQDRVRD